MPVIRQFCPATTRQVQIAIRSVRAAAKTGAPMRMHYNGVIEVPATATRLAGGPAQQYVYLKPSATPDEPVTGLASVLVSKLPPVNLKLIPRKLADEFQRSVGIASELAKKVTANA